MNNNLVIYLSLSLLFFSCNNGSKNNTYTCNDTITTSFETDKFIKDSVIHINDVKPSESINLDSPQPLFDAKTPSEAYDEGFERGREDGEEDGLNNDRDFSYDESNPYKGKMRRKYIEGYQDGYEEGLEDGLEEYNLTKESWEEETDW